MNILIIDPKASGISSDMLLSALVDLTGDENVLASLADAMRELSCGHHFSFQIDHVNSGCLTAARLKVISEEVRFKDKGELMASASQVLDLVRISESVWHLFQKIVDDLIPEESTPQRSSFVRRQILSLNTIFEILGSLLILEKKGFLEGLIYAAPPAIGSGKIRVDGEVMTGPDPLTLEILCRHKTTCIWKNVDQELTTPTGASILANIAQCIADPYPPMTLEAAGHGVGREVISGCSDVLRVVEGSNFRGVRDNVVMLETNLDDLSGEIIGYTVERLFEEGAVDVFVTPAMGKKNRPVNVISVITSHLEYQKLVKTLMEETGTLGVRVLEVPRLVADRSREPRRFEVMGKRFEVRVKTSTVEGTVVSIKPEYEDLKKIARSLGIPLRHVIDAVKRDL